jgi:hypothetical protein
LLFEKNQLEAQFLRGDFYPDLLDERISLLREKLREVLANLSSPASQEPEAARRSLADAFEERGATDGRNARTSSG